VLLSGGEFATASGGGEKPSAYGGVDVTALTKWSVGIAAQMSLLFGFLAAIDAALGCFPSVKVPFAANVAFLYAFNLRSSVFSILPSSKNEGRKIKDEDKGTQEYNKRNIPKWTPPGIAFVLGWPLLTFGLRAVTGAMVVQASGHRYATAAIMSLMLHFSVGNLWNTVYVFVCSRVSWFTSFTDIELIALMLNTFAISTVAMWSDVWGAPWCSSTPCG
jgi:tryptophan-rich sensory protein